MKISKLWISRMIAAIAVLFTCCQSNKRVEINNQYQYSNNQLNKLEYNNPELLVDLDAGFKAVPMPMDFYHL